MHFRQFSIWRRRPPLTCTVVCVSVSRNVTGWPFCCERQGVCLTDLSHHQIRNQRLILTRGLVDCLCTWRMSVLISCHFTFAYVSTSCTNFTTSTSVFGADPTSTRRAISRTAHLYGNVYMRVGMAHALADSSDFGLLGEQISQKFVIPFFGRRWTAVRNVALLALSSAEKSVTVQTQTNKNKQTNKQTVTDIFTPCLSACVDSNTTVQQTNQWYVWLTIGIEQLQSIMNSIVRFLIIDFLYESTCSV